MVFETKTRVRFAPSPTGDLHMGNARTALLNWLFARHYGGSFILRIEDTDQERSSKIFEKNLLDDLTWLGIDWDEGPTKEGLYGPYHQSERLDLYKNCLKQLMASDRVYPCYCTEEELEAERASLIARKIMPRYMGKCRHLSLEARQKLEKEGRRSAYRFKIGDEIMEFHDLIRGDMRFDSAVLGDFIIVRSTGVPSYNFAVVVDDHCMEITHVIRGEDHLTNTAFQLLIYKALGYTSPCFAHHSLILGKDRTKLSKRHGSVAMKEFKKRGFLPEALLNYLSLIGNSFGEGREIFSKEDIIKKFSLERIGKGGAIFDEDKLKWFNAFYIRQSDSQDLMQRLYSFLRQAGYDLSHYSPSCFHQIVEAVQNNLATLSDIGEYLDIFNDDKYQILDEARQLLLQEESRAVLRALYQTMRMQNADDHPYETLVKTVRVKTGFKGKKLYMPIRAAITGRTLGPELDKIFAVLGKSSILKRLQKVI
jgi:nondiscriminating glutamyl-tRNA synthetase